MPARLLRAAACAVIGRPRNRLLRPARLLDGKKRVPYVPTRTEVEDLISAAEAWVPRNRSLAWMALEYPMAFRLMWCCGLRLGEVAHMRREDAELDAGVLTVRHSSAGLPTT